ncbi:hypothetical protein [Catenulispora subtropica]|uniref:Uncharacterized protein n=1 Tax=Catenulispora subtropica TaxID=450798 RepID=A0ABN2RGG7_9ACTN
MTDIEERLPAILGAEADRHEVPVFSARAIAENAGRKGFRRRPVLLLAAIGLAGAAGATGAVVAAGGHGDGDRVTVTFKGGGIWVSHTPPKVDAVLSWVRSRVRAEGLKDVKVSMPSQDPPTIVVSGHAADLPRLRMLRLPGAMSLIEMERSAPADSTTAPVMDAKFCGGGGLEYGITVPVCDENGHVYSSFIEAGDSLHVTEAHAEQRRPGPGGWAIVARLDAAGAVRYASFLATVAKAQDPGEVAIDGYPVAQWVPGQPQPAQTGVIVSEPVFTEQQAKDFAVILTKPMALPEWGDVTVTVTPGG